METFPRYWPFVRGIHRLPVNSPHKGQWRGALMFSLICAWINGWLSNREAGDLRNHRGHYDVIIMGCVPMFPSPYLPQSLCSPVPMFPSPDVPQPYIPQFLCSPVPFFPHEVRPMFPSPFLPPRGTPYVPQTLCSPDPMLRSPFVPQSPCSPVPID